jgi:hypothetical protein
MKLLSAVILVFLLHACYAPMKIGYDIDNSINFAAYKTFAWVPNPDYTYKDQRYNSQIMENNIKSFVNNEMEMLGLKLDNKNPNLLITYDLQIEKGEIIEETPIMSNPQPIAPLVMQGMIPNNTNNNMWFNCNQQLNMWNNPSNFNGVWGNPMGGVFMPPPPQVIGYATRKIPFKNGVLTISVSDRKDNRLIWRSWGENCIIDPYTYKQQLNEKIKLMMAKYPRSN